MKRKGFAFLCASSLIFSSTLLASCNDDKNEIAPLPEEDDDIILNMEDEKPISEKILDVALEGIGSGVKGGISTIVTKVGTWAIDGISEKMGLPFASDNKYLKMIDERLGKIEDRLTNIESTVEQIAQQQKDETYKSQYKTYQDTYNEYDDAINLCWKSYSTIEKKLMFEGDTSALDEDQLKLNLDELSLKINKSGKEMSNAAHDLGKAFIAQDISSKITSLSQYSIFDIAKYFTDKETPYEELRYDAVVDVLVNSYTYFYQASVLTLIDLNYKLNNLGVTSYIMDKNDEIVAYSVEANDVETKYLNCLGAEKEETLEKIKNSGYEETEFKDLECKKFDGKLLGRDDELTLYTHNYNIVTKLVNSFLDTNYPNRTNTERHLTYTSGSKNGQKQVTKTLMQVKTPMDFIEWNKDEQTFLLDLSKFYQIDQGEFEGWCNTIKNSSIVKTKDATTKLTFRQYLKKVGYVSEKDLTNVKYLVLGSRTVSKKSFDDYYNNWFGYTNAWQLMTVDLDTVIDSFCQNKNYHPVTYCTYGRKYRKDNGCAVSFGYTYGLMESHSNQLGFEVQRNFKVSDNFDQNWKEGGKAVYPTKYLTIEGLSVSKSSGKINPVNTGKF